MNNRKRADLLCALTLLLATLLYYYPAVFQGKTLLPADIVLLMRPWGMGAAERFPEFHFAQNQMHGPIFEYYSWRYYAREQLLRGRIPLWNPDELGGNVLLANDQSAVLYPLNILLYLFPLPLGINLVTLLQTFLTGLFLYGLLRTLGLHSLSSVTAALIWMFCGLQIVWTEFQTPTATLCWLPALLWCWEIALQRRDGRWAVLGSGSGITLIMLAGHLQFGFYCMLAFAVYAILRSLKSLKTLAPWLIGAFAFGLLFSACTTIPIFEMSKMNFRESHQKYSESIRLRLPPENLLTLFLPNVFGNPKDYISVNSQGVIASGHPYIGKFDFIEYCFYLGIPAFILALIAFVYYAANRKKVVDAWANLSPFSIIALIGLLLGLGTPLCALFFYALPGYQQFNATARALCLFSFGMAAMAGWGMEALRKPDKSLARISVAACLVTLLAGLAAFPGLGLLYPKLFSSHWIGYELNNLKRFTLVFLFMSLALWMHWGVSQPSEEIEKSRRRDKQNLKRSSDSKLLSTAAPYLVSFICLADLFAWGIGFNPATNPKMLGFPTEVTNYLSRAYPNRIVSLENPGDGKDKGIHSMIVPNYNAVCNLREVQGADSLHTKRYHSLLLAISDQMQPGFNYSDPNTLHVPNVTSPFFNLMNVRYVTTVPEVRLPSPQFKDVLDAELTVWKNMDAFGQAWVAGKAIQVNTIQDVANHIGDTKFDLKGVAMLEKPLSGLDPDVKSATADVLQFSPQHMTVEVNTQGKDLLMLSEIAFPGWRAWLDGKPVPILTADAILRAVVVPPGRHIVRMAYLPMSYRFGLYLTCLMASLLSAEIIYRKRTE
jgi:hypothetical protein